MGGRNIFDMQNRKFIAVTIKGIEFNLLRDEDLIHYVQAIRTFCVNLGDDLNALVC